MMDDRQSEELKCQIEQTRCNLADKLETLEERVVEPATAAMTDSMTKVKEAVENTAEAMQSTMTKVTETFDLATHVRNYPWRMIGAGVATGFVLGQYLKPGPSNASTARSSSTPLPSNPETFRSNGRDHSEAAFPQQRSDSKISSEGWSKMATEVQGVVIHSLIPVVQGLLGAVLAKFLRRPPAQPASTARHPLDEDRDWTDGELTEDSDWGGRLRSLPK